ncbi:serine/threonine-protein kinase [Nocardia sp. NPDC127579]|uniref:serine/threonine-protein kinase n=1 Tax=Nocardia sp. NPDC127579 TaxID=3345402 RepID=UPI0036287B22
MLSQGAMGRVLLGRGPDRRLVAVKRIHRSLVQDPAVRARFAHEIAAARRVTGAYTAAITDADPDSADPWLASVFVPGPSLQEAVDADGPLHLGGLRLLLAGLASALGELHRAGLVHRDLKPGNLLLAADGPRIVDFGIARALDADGQLTATGTVLGSPAYMAPEQAEGFEPTSASDVFAVGAIMAMAATGIGPFGGTSAPQTLYNVVHAAPEISRVPPLLHPLVAACLSKNPADRPTFVQLLDAAARIPAEPAWPPAIRQRIAQREAEAAEWDRRAGVGQERPRRGWRVLAVAAAVGVLGVAAGLATGAVLPREVVAGVPESMIDPPMTLGAEELRRVDECVLLAERVTGDIGERKSAPAPYSGNSCRVSVRDRATGETVLVSLDIGWNMSAAVGTKDLGTSLGGMRVFGDQPQSTAGTGDYRRCRRTAVARVDALPGIEVSVGSDAGEPCRTADEVLRAVVFRLAVNPPLVVREPGSVLALAPCAALTTDEATAVVGALQRQPALFDIYRCDWTGVRLSISVALSAEPNPASLSEPFPVAGLTTYRWTGVPDPNRCQLTYPVRKSGAMYETVEVAVQDLSKEQSQEALCDTTGRVLTTVLARLPRS